MERRATGALSTKLGAESLVLGFEFLNTGEQGHGAILLDP
jgi:hypothetical protein